MSAARYAGLNAPVPKPVAESRRSEWLAGLSHKERDAAARRLVDDLLQLGADRNLHLNRLTVAILPLCKNEPTTPNVVWSKAHRVGSALACVKHQRHGEPCSGPDRVFPVSASETN